MRIAFVTNNYTPYSGGVVSSIDFFKKGLEAAGHKVYVITLDFANKPLNESADIIRIKGDINFFYNNNPISIPIKLDSEVKKIIEDLNIDIIHSHHPFFIGNAALYASNSLKIPIVFTHHTFYEHYAHNIPIPETISAPIIKQLDIKYCNKVDHIIAPGTATKKYLIENKIITPISIIPTGINDSFYANPKNKLKDRANKKLKLITVSRFTKEKNIPFLINVFSKLDQSEFEFNIVGFGTEEDNLKNLINSLQITKESIKFTIKPKKEDLINLYKESDLFLFASQSDTQGIVLAEAMASGCPIVSIEGPGQSDIVLNGINGFLIDTENDMVEKINQIKNNQDLLNKLSLNAFKKSHDYTEEHITKQISDLYKNIIEKSK